MAALSASMDGRFEEHISELESCAEPAVTEQEIQSRDSCDWRSQGHYDSGGSFAPQGVPIDSAITT